MKNCFIKYLQMLRFVQLFTIAIFGPSPCLSLTHMLWYPSSQSNHMLCVPALVIFPDSVFRDFKKSKSAEFHGDSGDLNFLKIC